MVAQVERRAEDGGAGVAGGQKMVAQVAQVEQEGRGWWRRWSRRAEGGGTGEAGGQRMLALVLCLQCSSIL